MNHGLTLGVFAILVAAMLGVIVWAGRRTKTTSDFWAAGRSIGSAQNGLAVAGDFMSAGTFLGTAGLIFLTGFDGTLILLAALFGFLPLLFLMAERLRNAGAFTLADVLALRFGGNGVRSAAAVATIVVSFFYLFSQMVAAGTLLAVLSGLNFAVAVLITGVFMTLYVVLGGMLGATWVMVVKAVLLLAVGVVLTIAVLAHTGGSLSGLTSHAAANSGTPRTFLRPGLLLPDNAPLSQLDIVSYGLIYMLGTAGLPHVLIRFFTVRNGALARRSLGWAIGVMGFFFLVVIVIGLGARALLTGSVATEASGHGGNLVAPILARQLGGGASTAGGDIALAIVAGIAFLTILAVVSGLLISTAGAVAHDLWARVIKHGSADAAKNEPKVARWTAVAMGALATAVSIIVGSGFNITFLLSLAFLVAASANLPVILLTLFWKSFTRTGAVVGLTGGLVVSLIVIVLSPTVLKSDPVITLHYPGIISIPAGFLCCLAGTVISRRERGTDNFAEMSVSTELGRLELGVAEPEAVASGG